MSSFELWERAKITPACFVKGSGEAGRCCRNSLLTAFPSAAPSMMKYETVYLILQLLGFIFLVSALSSSPLSANHSANHSCWLFKASRAKVSVFHCADKCAASKTGSDLVEPSSGQEPLRTGCMPHRPASDTLMTHIGLVMLDQEWKNRPFSFPPQVPVSQQTELQRMSNLRLSFHFTAAVEHGR